MDYVTVDVENKPNQNPIADTGGQYSGFIEEAIQFDGSNSYDPDGWIEEYEWDFGDGYTSNEENPIHIYTNPDNYVVSLTVIDNNNARNTTQTNAEIIMPLNYWYEKHIEDHKSTIDIVGIDAIIPISNKEDSASSLKFSIPAFSIERNGISIFLHSHLITDYRIASLKNNIIIKTMIWGAWKQLGEQKTSIFRFRVLNIQDEKIDYINIFQDRINNMNIHEIQYFLYGMSSRINRKNPRNDCNECILFKKCNQAEE